MCVCVRALTRIRIGHILNKRLVVARRFDVIVTVLGAMSLDDTSVCAHVCVLPVQLDWRLHTEQSVMCDEQRRALRRRRRLYRTGRGRRTHVRTAQCIDRALIYYCSMSKNRISRSTLHQNFV